MDCSPLARDIVHRLCVWLQPGKKNVASKNSSFEKCRLWCTGQALTELSTSDTSVFGSKSGEDKYWDTLHFQMFWCVSPKMSVNLFVIDAYTILEMLCDVSAFSPCCWLLFLLSLNWCYSTGMAHKQVKNKRKPQECWSLGDNIPFLYIPFKVKQGMYRWKVRLIVCENIS